MQRAIAMHNGHMTFKRELWAPPLLERLPDVAIPGALLLSRYNLCNGATIVGAEPLSIKMPQAQWAYGIKFPLDHNLSERLADASCGSSLSWKGGRLE